MAIVNDEWEITANTLSGRGRISYYHIAAGRLTEMGNAPYSGEAVQTGRSKSPKRSISTTGFLVEAYQAALDHFAAVQAAGGSQDIRSKYH